jgi:dTDP-4-amino-4,6-dideoxygalactose transaminase
MKKIRLSKYIVDEAEKNVIYHVIYDSYLGMDKFVHQFEERLKEYLGINHVGCISSETVILHLILYG